MNFLLSNFLFCPHTNAEQTDAISSLCFPSLKDRTIVRCRLLQNKRNNHDYNKISASGAVVQNTLEWRGVKVLKNEV
jgi:hypothetical protein